MRKVGVVVAGVVAALLLGIAGVVWWAGPAATPGRPGAGEQAQAELLSAQPLRVARPSVLRRDPAYFSCPDRASRPFAPVRISVTDVTRGASVLALPRDAAGVPGVPPLTTTGKSQFAWDAPGIRPGEDRGNAILNAHTWPDGTALGNRLLAGLHEGERLTLHGASGRALCYEVTERTEVLDATADTSRVYDTDGPHQIVIVVCSGTRVGPGQWTHRTLWFASPVS